MFTEVMEIFFANQYQGIFPFLHKPSFMYFLGSEDFKPETYIEDYSSKVFDGSYTGPLSFPDPVLLLAILALCSRLHPGISEACAEFSEESSPETFELDFSSFTPAIEAELVFNAHRRDLDLTSASNASKYYGWHARNLLKEVFDTPTVQRIQSFTLLSSHEWGEGNNARSFLYIGIAARMALVLGLGNEQAEDPESSEDLNVRQIVLESKRRTLWSVYMMDRCNSSGRQRSPAIRIEDISIRLPSTENDFLFGSVNTCLTYQELSNQLGGPLEADSGEISLVGLTINLFEIWAKIAKWVGEVGVKNETELPWLTELTFHSLSWSLNQLAAVLPSKFQLTQYNLETHIELGTATHFGYFHGLFLICRIFLNREYLFCNPESFPTGWWSDLILQLLLSLEKISAMLETLRMHNMMVIAPFTGFEVFTSAVTLFYFCAFPNDILHRNLPVEEYGVEGTEEEVANWKFKYKKLALDNLEQLLTWAQAWELGRKWQKLAVSLGVLFGQLAKNGSSEFNADYLRHSMQDYGSSEVLETISPKNHDNSEREIFRILNKEAEGQTTEENPGEVESGGPNAIELLSMPILPFSDLPSIYPGWIGN